MNTPNIRKAILTALAFSFAVACYPRCGSVDYSWGADALSSAHDYAITMLLYIVYLSYAGAGIIAIIGALQIYVKMHTGDGDITKSLMMLIGACLFLVGATIVFPAFFGYSI